MRKIKLLLVFLLVASIFALLTGYFYYKNTTPEAKYFIDLINNNFSATNSKSFVLIDKNKYEQVISIGKNFIPVDSFNQKHVDWLIDRENSSFYHDLGIDPIASAHALWNRILFGKKNRGSSTITMQLIKILSQKDEITFSRKFAEISDAVKITKSLSKKTILSCYLNLVPIGKAVGIPQASLFYFNKHYCKLNDNEFLRLLSAIPGMDDSWNRYDRYAKIFLQEGKISSAEFVNLIENKPVLLYRHDNQNEELFSPVMTKILTENLNLLKDTVHTTISFSLQDTLQSIIQSYLKNNFSDIVQASFILCEADNMQSICYINTSSIGPLQYDMIESSLSRPFSRIKPFTYSLFIDNHLNNFSKDNLEFPTNYNYKYTLHKFAFNPKYSCNLSDALAHSLNSPAEWVLNEKVGLQQFKDILVTYNILSDTVKLFADAAIGAFEISESNLLQLMRAALYNGKIMAPEFSYILNKPELKIIDSVTTVLIRDALVEGISKGTSRGLRGIDSLGIKIWNKTGSADEGNGVGCSGLFEFQNEYYIYSLHMESKINTFTYASKDAVPLLKKIFTTISDLNFLLK